jgi:lipoyl(octanoyl) transferase
MDRILNARYLGLVPYGDAFELQQRLVQKRAEGAIPDTIILLQHPPVLTTGRFRGEKDIIAPPEILSREGIAIFPTNRGGSVTYHGPGQLVDYPILNLKELRLGVRDYVNKLEEVIISLLRRFHVIGERHPDYPGVWVGGEKICSIGIHVSRGITMHGFAFNVVTDLHHFSYIKPCGMTDKRMTSLTKVLTRPVAVEEIVKPVLDCFSEVFSVTCMLEDGAVSTIPDRR